MNTRLGFEAASIKLLNWKQHLSKNDKKSIYLGTFIPTALCEGLASIENLVRAAFMTATAITLKIPLLGLGHTFKVLHLNTAGQYLIDKQSYLPDLLQCLHSAWKAAAFAAGSLSTLTLGTIKPQINYELHKKLGLVIVSDKQNKEEKIKQGIAIFEAEYSKEQVELKKQLNKLHGNLESINQKIIQKEESESLLREEIEKLKTREKIQTEIYVHFDKEKTALEEAYRMLEAENSSLYEQSEKNVAEIKQLKEGYLVEKERKETEIERLNELIKAENDIHELNISIENEQKNLEAIQEQKTLNDRIIELCEEIEQSKTTNTMKDVEIDKMQQANNVLRAQLDAMNAKTT